MSRLASMHLRRPSRAQRSDSVGSEKRRVARADNRGWSLMESRGCNRWQSVCKLTWRGNGQKKPKPLPSVATGCREEYMVSRASAVGCHPLPVKEEVDLHKAASPANPRAHRT